MKIMSDKIEIISDKINEIAKALSMAQGSFKNVIKEKNGHNYKYADLGAYLDAIREPFLKNNLSVSQLIDIHNEEFVVYTIIMHSSGQWLKSTFPVKSALPRGGNEMQGLGSGISYARRYGLAAAVGLTQEDDDAITTGKPKNDIPPPEKMIIDQLREKQQSLFSTIHKKCNEYNISAKEFLQFHEVKLGDTKALEYVVNEFITLYEKYKETNTEDV